MRDPIFQQRNFFTVADDNGQELGRVYVLDREHLPHHSSNRKKKERMKAQHLPRRKRKN
ncbi:hypothetical protein [Paenibacillus hunanensis]|uniref:Uncharacterized protein n=1 Tax=Paenibacillus hunanensis TaxID=539262 RepID=A0ABU1IVD1_9BACL|nr:hypothetical protein [Paenibacillus hunanensis]MDR6243178.1 hypothetical protein [Paenibacillus hunanensis]GGJ11263.1 hypothetical protein GCM10008022_20470 [Paenibacillus hunanensis]